MLRLWKWLTLCWRNLTTSVEFESQNCAKGPATSREICSTTFEKPRVHTAQVGFCQALALANLQQLGHARCSKIDVSHERIGWWADNASGTVKQISSVRPGLGWSRGTMGRFNAGRGSIPMLGTGEQEHKPLASATWRSMCFFIYLVPLVSGSGGRLPAVAVS